MSMWENCTQKQLNYIQVLLRNTNATETYWGVRKILPSDLSKAEASDLIEMLTDGREDHAITTLNTKIKEKSG